MDAGSTAVNKHGEQGLRIYGSFQIGPQQRSQGLDLRQRILGAPVVEAGTSSELRNPHHQPVVKLAESTVAVGARL